MFKDKRGREWEIFIDPAYYDTTCVRCLAYEDAKDFNSPLAFHFDTYERAELFAKLVENSR